MRYILASASPRRQELLKRIIPEFDVVISDFEEESIKFHGDVSQFVIDIAMGKAKAVSYINNESIIIAADTVVSLNGKILGKPNNEEMAFEMLKELSGKSHEVYTGIAIINPTTNNTITDSICTEVKFSSLSENEIRKYIATGEAFDKAGAYGIQGYGGLFVEEIKGCYYNVMGLPLNCLNKIIIKTIE